MLRHELKHEARRARRARLWEHMQAGMPVPEIADREGMDLDYVAKQRRKIAKEEGFTIWEQPRLSAEKREKVLPYGMTAASATMRRRLGDYIAARHHKGKEMPADLSAVTGLTETQQRLARQNPANCNWTISQLERLARHEGKDFVSFMRELLA